MARRLAPKSRQVLYTVCALALAFSINSSTALASDLATQLDFPFASEAELFSRPLPRIHARATSTILNLLDYIHQSETRDSLADIEARVPRYNRRNDFGGWINANPSAGCLDTRGLVLVRSADANSQVTYRDASKCSVVKGLWHDPYTGNDFKLAKAVQIDHVVPLKHAYLTGAWNWSPERRCYYANFLNNRFHLLAVSGHENMSKSDGGPENYLPPDQSFNCEYVSTWMKIKAIWKLVSTAPEVTAIEQVIRDQHCSMAKLEYSSNELDQERSATLNPPQRCKDFAATGTIN